MIINPGEYQNYLGEGVHDVKVISVDKIVDMAYGVEKFVITFQDKNGATIKHYLSIDEKFAGIFAWIATSCGWPKNKPFDVENFPAIIKGKRLTITIEKVYNQKHGKNFHQIKRFDACHEKQKTYENAESLDDIPYDDGDPF